jgi:N-acetylglucosaminyldiphosphoundecaprenol N-acetyl-beta-D-mannosaminyltransferase
VATCVGDGWVSGVDPSSGALRRLPAVTVGGVEVVSSSLSGVLLALWSDLELERVVADRGAGLALWFVNASSIAHAQKDESYFRLLSGHGGIALPDGWPVAWVVSRRSGGVGEQVRGPSFFPAALGAGRERGVKHYLFGGSPDTLSLLCARIEKQFPGVAVAGSESPPFRELATAEREEVFARISASGAELVWVGLGSPKQDYWAEQIAARCGVIACGVGAAFDFLAGTREEAPLAVRRMGLEWMFRLVSEPRRLWRRYLFGNMRFIFSIIAPRNARRR